MYHGCYFFMELLYAASEKQINAINSNTIFKSLKMVNF